MTCYKKVKSIDLPETGGYNGLTKTIKELVSRINTIPAGVKCLND